MRPRSAIQKGKRLSSKLIMRVVCGYCGVETFKMKRSERNLKFCSRQCCAKSKILSVNEKRERSKKYFAVYREKNREKVNAWGRDHWRRWAVKNGIERNGTGISKEEKKVYRDLLTIFNPSDIVVRTRSVIRNPETKYPLELDLYIPKIKFAIEVDGEVHWKAIYGQEGYLRQRKLDRIKELECSKQGIILVRVPYSSELNMFGNKALIPLL